MNFGYQTETVTYEMSSFLPPSRHKDPSLLPQAVCEIQPCCIFAHRSSSDHFYNLCIAAQFMIWTALLLPSISLSSFPIFIKNNLILSGRVPTLWHTCQWERYFCEVEEETVELWTTVVHRPRVCSMREDRICVNIGYMDLRWPLTFKGWGCTYYTCFVLGRMHDVLRYKFMLFVCLFVLVQSIFSIFASYR